MFSNPHVETKRLVAIIAHKALKVVVLVVPDAISDYVARMAEEAFGHRNWLDCPLCLNFSPDLKGEPDSVDVLAGDSPESVVRAIASPPCLGSDHFIDSLRGLRLHFVSSLVQPSNLPECFGNQLSVFLSCVQLLSPYLPTHKHIINVSATERATER